MSQELTAEDQALLAALEALERETEPASPAPEAGQSWPVAAAAAAALATARSAGSAATPDSNDVNREKAEEQETLTRLYHEVLGLVPSALPPVTPRSEVKRRLMAAISGEEPARLPRSAPQDEARAAQPPPFLAAAAPPATPARHAAGASAAPLSRPPRRAWLVLAAALILALGGTCGWLYRSLRVQGETITQLSDQRNAAQRQVGETQARLERLTTEVKSLRDNVSIVTSPAVEICALRPAAPANPEGAGPHGVLFVAADHQHWYMSLRGLRPAGSGKVYQLWFVAAQGTVSGGTFSAESGSPWELGAAHMPAGTKEVRVTLENGTGSPAPSGPEVLRNAEVIRVL